MATIKMVDGMSAIRDGLTSTKDDISRIDNSISKINKKYNNLRHRDQIHHKKLMSKLDETYDKVNDVYLTTAIMSEEQNHIIDKMISDHDDIKELAGVTIRQQDNLLLQSNRNNADMIVKIAELTSLVKFVCVFVTLTFGAMIAILLNILMSL